jgi:CBS domain-containing protein
MNIDDVCSRNVYCVREDQALAEVAREMSQRHIGTAVVVEPRGDKLRPVGILTDRDIVCGQVALAKDLFCLSVVDVMTPEPLTLSESSGLAESISAMKEKGVRRAPVVDSAGDVTGLVSIDDLLPALARQLGTLAKTIELQAHRGTDLPS